MQACKMIWQKVAELKTQMATERQRANLQKFQACCGSDIMLVNDHRQFVLEGKLKKIPATGNNKTQEYVFLLFNDLVLYASDGMQSRYKVHRVMHLSLCTLVDLRGPTYNGLGFKISSPQKTVTLVAKDEKEKTVWLDAMTEQLVQERERRKKYMASLSTSGTAAMLSADDKEGDLLRRYSTFVGHTSSDLMADAKGNKKQVAMCKLCIRPLGFLKRRTKCKMCDDTVCNECCNHKVKITKGGKSTMDKVCDECYGYMNNMTGDDVHLVTVDTVN